MTVSGVENIALEFQYRRQRFGAEQEKLQASLLQIEMFHGALKSTKN